MDRVEDGPLTVFVAPFEYSAPGLILDLASPFLDGLKWPLGGAFAIVAEFRPYFGRAYLFAEEVPCEPLEIGFKLTPTPFGLIFRMFTSRGWGCFIWAEPGVCFRSTEALEICVLFPVMREFEFNPLVCILLIMWFWTRADSPSVIPPAPPDMYPRETCGWAGPTLEAWTLLTSSLLAELLPKLWSLFLGFCTGARL